MPSRCHYFNENKTEIKDYLLKLANSKIGELAEKVPVAGGLIKSITNKFFSKFITPEEKDMTVKELNENIQQYKKELEDLKAPPGARMQRSCSSRACDSLL